MSFNGEVLGYNYKMECRSYSKAGHKHTIIMLRDLFQDSEFGKTKQQSFFTNKIEINGGFAVCAIHVHFGNFSKTEL